MDRLTRHGVTLRVVEQRSADGRLELHSPELGVAGEGSTRAEALLALTRRIDRLLCERGVCGALAWSAG